MRTSFALLLLVACEPGKPKHHEKPIEHKRVVDLRMTVPEGWTSAYDAIADRWSFSSEATRVVFERTPESSTLSPEALRQALGLHGDIESRAGINDGFVMTLVDGGKRDVYVVRQIYNHDWFRCVATVRSDDVRDQVIALCKSLKRPRRT